METCIVCLGDLAALEGQAQEDRHQLDSAQTTSFPITLKTEDDPNTVAHLLPCGHNLHHECLRPWVERANSCPICRANFNMVELSAFIDGMRILYLLSKFMNTDQLYRPNHIFLCCKREASRSRVRPKRYRRRRVVRRSSLAAMPVLRR